MRVWLTAMLALMASDAMACSCIPLTRDQVIDKSDLVAEGTVTKADTPAKSDFVIPLVAQFHVTKRIKGDGPATITVMTAGSDAACGIALPEGATLELALKKTNNGIYHATSCAQMGLKH